MRPIIWFLVRFFATYSILSITYSWYISGFTTKSGDPITMLVSEQIVAIGDLLGNDWKLYEPGNEKSIWIMENDYSLVRMFEGCNGITIMILFVSFLFGLSAFHSSLLWFIPAGLLLIHLANLIRIYALILVQVNRPEWTGFVHKYLFTLILYAFVFALWVWWVQILKKKR